MMKRILFSIILKLTFFQCLFMLTMIAAVAQDRPSRDVPLKVVDAPEWDEIFNRTSGGGWYSGDGQFSVPFNGIDTNSTGKATKTFWLFSDTHFCSGMDASTYVVSGDKMINHSVATMNTVPASTIPVFNDVEYLWGTDGDKTKTNMFGSKMWAVDGISINDTINMFMMEKTNGAASAINQVRIPIVNGEIDVTNYIKRSTPFFEIDAVGETRLGSAIMDNTLEGGAHTPDGYVYIYGARKVGYHRGFIVGRVPKATFNDFSTYTFWNGSTWTSDYSDLHTDAAEIAGNATDRYSVTQIHTGPFTDKYMMIYERNLWDPVIEYRIANSPEGPWGDPVPIYGQNDDLEEYGVKDPDFYGAKAHPHLSDPGELLISYCLNMNEPTTKTHNKNRGRFIRLKLDELADDGALHMVSLMNVSAFASGQYGDHLPWYAFGRNKKDSYYWEDATPGDKWIGCDLGMEYYVEKYQVVNHGYMEGGNSLNNTRDWVLQYSNDSINWVGIDTIVGNTQDLRENIIPQTYARYWRLYITDPHQRDWDVARILNINLFGRAIADKIILSKIDVEKENKVLVYPTFVKDFVHFDSKSSSLEVEVWSITGRMHLKKKVENSRLDLSFLNSGIYILKVDNNTFKIVKQ
jgi:hypothetical protein